MAQYDYDLFTIGAGSGGVRASRDVGLIRRQGRGGRRSAISAAPASTSAASRKNYWFTHLITRDDFDDLAGYGWTVGRAEIRLGQTDRQ